MHWNSLIFCVDDGGGGGAGGGEDGGDSRSVHKIKLDYMYLGNK